MGFSEIKEKVGQDQIQDLLFDDRLSWQTIIYDLINSEQLDPWDIDLSVLANKYIVRVRELEEANFFISSKVLLDAYLPIPKRLVNLHDKIKGLYSKLKEIFMNSDQKVAFSTLSSLYSEERLLNFVSLLHLDTQQKVWLEQEGHFEEIWILLKEVYESKNKDLLE